MHGTLSGSLPGMGCICRALCRAWVAFAGLFFCKISSSTREARALYELIHRNVHIRVVLFPNKETLFFSSDLFPVKYQTGDTASGQQGGARSGKG